VNFWNLREKKEEPREQYPFTRSVFLTMKRMENGLLLRTMFWIFFPIWLTENTINQKAPESAEQTYGRYFRALRAFFHFLCR
jgi:hypothetical protein